MLPVDRLVYNKTWFDKEMTIIAICPSMDIYIYIN